MTSKYIGTPEKWVEFIVAWQQKKQRIIRQKKGLLDSSCVSNFSIELTESCLHFYVAMDYLGWPNICKILWEDEDSGCDFNFLPPKEIEMLAYYDASYFNALIGSHDAETVPVQLANAEYRNYSRSQDDLLSSRLLIGSYVIAEKKILYSKINFSLILWSGILGENGKLFISMLMPRCH